MNDILKHIFGEIASEFIFKFLEQHASLKRKEGDYKCEVFYAYLEKLFGSECSRIIQFTMLRCLFARLRQECEEIEMYFSLLDKLYEFKRMFLIPSSLQDALCFAADG